MIEWNEQQRMIQKMVRDFVAKEVVPNLDDIEYNGVPPYDILRKLFSTFGMDEKSVLIFAIALNATAGLGAVGFAWMDDKVGARTTLTWTLGCLMIVSTAILLVQSALWFWILGIVLGTFIGPVQSASRSLMARLAPPAMTGEMFGFFALSGKLTSFAGPLLVGLVAYATDSQRLGMGVIVVLMAIGLIILRTVPEPEKG